MTETPYSATPPITVDRLAEIRSKRAELKAQADALRNDEAAQLAAAELELANETAIVAAQVQYGPQGQKWDGIITRLGAVLVKRPNDAVYKKFQEDPKFDFDSLEAYVAPCVFYPKPAEFSKIYGELPGIIGELVGKIGALMGERRAEQAKK